MPLPRSLRSVDEPDSDRLAPGIALGVAIRCVSSAVCSPRGGCLGQAFIAGRSKEEACQPRAELTLAKKARPAAMRMRRSRHVQIRHGVMWYDFGKRAADFGQRVTRLNRSDSRRYLSRSRRGVRRRDRQSPRPAVCTARRRSGSLASRQPQLSHAPRLRTAVQPPPPVRTWRERGRGSRSPTRGPAPVGNCPLKVHRL